MCNEQGQVGTYRGHYSRYWRHEHSIIIYGLLGLLGGRSPNIGVVIDSSLLSLWELFSMLKLGLYYLYVGLSCYSKDCIHNIWYQSFIDILITKNVGMKDKMINIIITKEEDKAF